jgi:hypothetical protein
MEKPDFTWAQSSNIRVIVVIMRVLVVEQLCQSVMRWISALECLLSGVHG